MTKNIGLILAVLIFNVVSSLLLYEVWLVFIGDSDNPVTAALGIVWVMGAVLSIVTLCQYWKPPLRSEAEKLVQEALDAREIEKSRWDD